jgi:ComF family protein
MQKEWKWLKLTASNSQIHNSQLLKASSSTLLTFWSCKLDVGSWLRGAADGTAAVILAPLCAACRVPLEHPTRGAVCSSCWASIVPITPPCCRTCGDPLPSWRAISIEDTRCPRCRRTSAAGTRVSLVRAIGRYEGSLRAIVHALKYDGRPTIARHLAARMHQSGGDVLEDADCVVPVPLHGSRERARGFNQARELARHLGLPVIDAVSRTRRTASQADLPAARRHANVRGAFVVRKGARIEGRTVVLVDDVSTTGATLNACAGPLFDAGAADVRALVAAKAVTRRP